LRPAPRHSRPPQPRPSRLPQLPRLPRSVTALLLLAGLAGALTVSARAFPPASPQRQAQLVPSAAWLGAWVQPASFSRQVQQDAVLELERQIGRRLAIDHTYVPWRAPLGWRPAWDVSLGRIPLITFGNGGNTTEIAQGRHDVYLRQLSEAVRALGKPVFLRYAHRMDLASAGSWVGGPASYVAAWRHVHEIFAGLPVSWVWTPTAAGFSGDQPAERFYPGDDYVDWIAADGYNGAGCGGQSGWRQLSDVFGDFYAWGSARGKPLMIAEAGTVEDPADPGRKAAWFDNAARQLATEMPNVQALVYFHAKKACDYRVDTSARSLEAFKRLAQDPHFQTQPLPPTTTTLKPGPTTTTKPKPGPTTTAPSPGPSPGPGGSLSAIMAPSGGALWGTSKFDRSWESQMGRKFDIAHFYHQWTSNFPTAEERSIAAEGRLLLLNWKMPSPWSSVANGGQDGQIAATAGRLKALGRKVFLAPHHEPEDQVGSYGSASDYARAFRRIVDEFRQAGANNVIFVWNMMGYVGGHGDIYPQLYPGDSYVDWIAYDPYNWYGCKSGHKPRSFAEITKPMYDWTAAHAPGKPLMLAEFGVREQPAGMPSKAQWFKDALTTLKTTRTRIKALVYFNTNHACDWRITSSASSVAAYKQIGLDGFLNRLH
jgi:beta-mannanase